MNCFDCTTETPPIIARPAVGMCVLCGAGVCSDHATVTTHHLTRIELVNREVPIEPPARRIYCHTCAAAVVVPQILCRVVEAGDPGHEVFRLWRGPRRRRHSRKCAHDRSGRGAKIWTKKDGGRWVQRLIR